MNTFAGQISGSGSLVLTGGSTLYLTNTANSYTGYTDILSGTLAVNNLGELGNSSLPIVVMGSANNSYPLPNGELILQGGSTGLTVNRNLDVGGYGTGQIGGNDGFSLISIGNNTFNGIITAAASMDTRIFNASGISTVSTSWGAQYGRSELADNGFIMTGAGNLYVNGLVTGGALAQSHPSIAGAKAPSTGNCSSTTRTIISSVTFKSPAVSCACNLQGVWGWPMTIPASGSAAVNWNCASIRAIPTLASRRWIRPAAPRCTRLEALEGLASTRRSRSAGRSSTTPSSVASTAARAM